MVSAATTNTIAYGLEFWRGDIYSENQGSTSDLEYFSGELWYIALVFGGGLTNGLIQTIPFFRYPNRLHCLYAEVRDGDGGHGGAPSILLANSLGLALGGEAHSVSWNSSTVAMALPEIAHEI